MRSTDESPEEPRTTIVPQFIRQVAAVAVVAFVLGRMVAPGLRGTREGLDGVIFWIDQVSAFASYLFAFFALSAVIFALMMTSREVRFGPVYRIGAAALGACVVSLVAPAFRARLPEMAAIVAAVASALLALLASREAITVPRTRAVGVLLFIAGVAALLHLAGSLLAWYAGERALQATAVFARLVATASVFFDSLTLVVAFAWLTTRAEKTTVWAARIALFVGCVVAAGAARSASLDNAPLWTIVAYRSVDRLVQPAIAYVWLPFRFVLETCAPLLAVAALTARAQMPGIAASVALVLLARPSTDVPLAALALTLAAFSTPLAARDDRGMWAVIMASARPPDPLAKPATPRAE